MKVCLVSKLLILMTAGLFSCSGNGRRTMKDFEDVNAAVIQHDVLDMPCDQGKCVTVKVDISQERDHVNISEIADSVVPVFLETPNDNVLIGKVDKLVVHDGAIYILDRSKSRGVYRFSLSGEFLASIGCVGQGPGEYAEPTDFSVRGSCVYVYDQFLHRLSCFSPDGKFLSDKKVPFLALGFHIFNDSTYLFSNLDADNHHLSELVDYSMFVTDSTFKVKQRGFYRKHGVYSSIWIPENFQSRDSVVYYHVPFSEKIFTVNVKGEIRERYRIDFKSKTLPEKYLLAENWKAFTNESTQSNYLLFPGTYYDTNSLLYFSYLDNHITHHGFYKKNGKSLVLAKGIRNDICPELSFGKIVSGYGNVLVSAVYPDMLLYAMEQYSDESLKAELGDKGVEVKAKLRAGDNPILLFSYLKKGKD